MQKKTPNIHVNHERRRFFRIHHELLFDIKPVDAHTAEQGLAADEFHNGRALEQLGELNTIDALIRSKLSVIQQKDRDLGDFLDLLDQKVSLLSRHIMHTPSLADEDVSRVNLSEEGLAFHHDRALYKGNYIAVRLVFLPEMLPLTLFAKVVRCEPESDDTDETRYNIAAQFYKLTNSDRQRLTKQIFKAQTRKRATS